MVAAHAEQFGSKEHTMIVLPFPNESRYSLRCSGLSPDDHDNIQPFFLNIADRIVASISQSPTESNVLDFSQCVVLPKFVNAHAHLELSGFAEPISWNGSFSDWIGEVMQHRRSEKYSLESAVRIGEKELHDSGTGPIYDIIPPQDTVTRNSKTWRFLELIAWNPDQAAEKLSLAENFLKQNQQVGLSPHAPNTVCPELLRGAVRLSRIYKAPLAMHLAETRDEIRLLREHRGPLLDMMRRIDPDYLPETTLLGNRPLDYLKCLAGADRCLVVHGNYLDEEEIRFLADHRNMTVVFCPVAHRYFGHQTYPIRRMLDLNVSLALGTDSRASWPDEPLSMVKTINTLLTQYPEVKTKEALFLATGSGYHATGLAVPCLKKGVSLDDFNALRWP